MNWRRPPAVPANHFPTPTSSSSRHSPAFASVSVSGFAAEAGWIPPIPVSGVTANIIGLGADWSSRRWAAYSIANLSLNASFGSVHGSFTCDEQDVLDPANSCYQGTPSDDSFNAGGLWRRPDAWRVPSARAQCGRTSAAAIPASCHASRSTSPTALGILDDNRVEANLNAAAIFGGLTWELARRWSVTGQFYTAGYLRQQRQPHRPRSRSESWAIVSRAAVMGRGRSCSHGSARTRAGAAGRTRTAQSRRVRSASTARPRPATSPA